MNTHEWPLQCFAVQSGTASGDQWQEWLCEFSVAGSSRVCDLCLQWGQHCVRSVAVVSALVNLFKKRTVDKATYCENIKGDQNISDPCACLWCLHLILQIITEEMTLGWAQEVWSFKCRSVHVQELSNTPDRYIEMEAFRTLDWKSATQSDSDGKLKVPWHTGWCKLHGSDVDGTWWD